MEEKFNGEKIVEGTCNCCGLKTSVLEVDRTCFVCTICFVEYKDPCKNCLKYWKGFDENKKDA